MKDFKLFGGKNIDDLGEYCKQYIKSNSTEHSELIIYVGTDSKQLRKNTFYATVVVFYHVGKGAHIIFTRKKVPKIKDLFTRLYNEVEMTRNVAEYLHTVLKGNYFFKWTENNIWVEIGSVKAQKLKESGKLKQFIDEYNKKLEFEKLITCDLDLNPDKLYKSNIVHDVGVGALRGSGFRTRTKPNGFSATCAADLLVR